MKVILAEKPSVGIDIAKALIKAKEGKNLKASSKDGFIKVDETTVVTWAIGHLVEIDDEIAPRKWSLENLPILPESFKYKPLEGRENQLKIIRKLLEKAKEVIIATDAGREGELIGRLIVNLSKFKGTVKRFWTSDALTEDTVIRELQRVRSIEEFDSLYFSALARQHADWIVGINLTRLITVKSGWNAGGVWSVGRVQTPTLRLIVERFEENKNFKPKEYFEIKGIFKSNDVIYEGLLEKPKDLKDDDFIDEDEEENKQQSKFRFSKALKDKILNELKDEKRGFIEDIKVQKKKEAPPKLLSLTALQRAANSLYGFSAQKTLSIAQKLYETYKCLSYPRTDAEYLGEDKETKDLVRSLLTKLGYKELTKNIDKVGKRVFDSSKLTDHHALIPFGKLPKEASPDEQKIYNLVLLSFIGAFMEDYVYETITIKTNLKNYIFITKLDREVLDEKDFKKTWKSLYEDYKKDLIAFNKLSKQDIAINLSIEETQKFTKPPALYTEATLLKKMENLNLGTPSTRANIIETLIERNYIVRENKSLVPTVKGIELVNLLKHSSVSSPEMTSQWEKKLESIYLKKEDKTGYQRFMNEIKGYITDEVNDLKLSDIKPIKMATKKMVMFAKSLAKKHGVKMPSSLDFDTITNFINTYYKKEESKLEKESLPTEKQISFAKALSEKLNEDIPQEALTSSKAISLWIKDAIKRTGYKPSRRRKA